MGECPSCGATVGENYRFCRHCGTSLEQGDQGGREEPNQVRHASKQPQSSEKGQPVHSPGQRQQQPAARQQSQQPGSGRSRTQRAPGASQDHRNGGLSRRTLLAVGGVGVAALGLGGVLAKDALLGPDCRGPKGTVRCFFHALNNENTERARELTHSEKADEFDSMVQGNVQSLIDFAERLYGEEELQRSEDGPTVTSSVEELTLESGGQAGPETDGSATVVADMRFEMPMADQEGSYTATVDLRTEDGEWTVWAIEYDFDALGGMGW